MTILRPFSDLQGHERLDLYAATVLGDLLVAMRWQNFVEPRINVNAWGLRRWVPALIVAAAEEEEEEEDSRISIASRGRRSRRMHKQRVVMIEGTRLLDCALDLDLNHKRASSSSCIAIPGAAAGGVRRVYLQLASYLHTSSPRYLKAAYSCNNFACHLLHFWVSLFVPSNLQAARWLGGCFGLICLCLEICFREFWQLEVRLPGREWAVWLTLTVSAHHHGACDS